MTKKHGNLWKQIVTDENIRQALNNAFHSKGHNSPTKKKTLAYAKSHVDEIIKKQKEYLLDKDRDYGQYSVYPRFDPKLRLIYSASFSPYRVSHHAVMNILKPIWDSLMYEHSYACRDNYGQHNAGLRCAQYVRKFKYALQLDVSQFYPSVDHEILKVILRRKIKDADLLQFLDGLIDGVSTRHTNREIATSINNHDAVVMIEKIDKYVTEFGSDRQAGVPTGNYSSQWFGNIYLNEADRFLVNNGMTNFVRYCDDTVCFGNDKDFLQELKQKYVEFLHDKLNLLVSKAEVFQTKQGVDFCGYVYHADGYVLLRKRTARKHRQVVTEISNSYHAGRLDNEKARSRLASIYGWMIHANSFNFREKIGFNSLYQEVVNDGEILRVC